MDLRIVDSKTKTESNSGKKNRSGNNQNQRSSTSRNDSNNAGSGSRRYNYLQEVKDRIRKEGRCWKCLKPGHRSGDENAPCKGASPLTKEQVEVVLKSMGVEDTRLDTTGTPELESKN